MAQTRVRELGPRVLPRLEEVLISLHLLEESAQAAGDVKLAGEARAQATSLRPYQVRMLRRRVA